MPGGLDIVISRGEREDDRVGEERRNLVMMLI